MVPVVMVSKTVVRRNSFICCKWFPNRNKVLPSCPINFLYVRFETRDYVFGLNDDTLLGMRAVW
jgi:hypothetical protein